MSRYQINYCRVPRDRDTSCHPGVLGEPVSRVSASENNDDAMEFSEEELVALHWWLLRKVSLLSDPRTPLDEKFELVRWVFTDPVRDTQPFSFVNCMKVVSGSPLSQLPFIGAIDAQEVRDWIGSQLCRWFLSALQDYPEWARQAVLEKPDWVSDNLFKNPQWMNEQIKLHQSDLFASPIAEEDGDCLSGHSNRHGRQASCKGGRHA
ncbi:hypothetical protein [Janthinobacterium sp. 1_2014MBL_MicDiv]|uniref:hypothetical protein n=1 Tax=Janthinobacterium sp. 1_2014MBL_MicDiv TaxID=1644131 RepID=UPI0012EB74F7|nr:hypothetical protein [Janthinobacterium sp. 1_2014MBL_MicDiv]